jgi:23S rRNA (uracil-5-)-methyltransferase rumA
MKKNKNIIIENVTVIDAGAKGKSVAKAPDGRVIFISNAVPGDVVDVQTTKKKSAYYEGQAIKYHQLSKQRVTPICKHFGYCGGCKWQNMSYESQLYYKQKEVENNLVRLGRIEIPELMPIIGSEDIYYYRNKMEFSFSDMRWLTPEEIKNADEIENRNGLGFHISGAWDKVLDIDECHLQADPSNAIRQEIKRFALAHNMAFYSPRQQIGFLRSMMIRITSTDEIMLVIQFYKEDKEKRELLLQHIADTFPQITSLQYCINSKGNDAIYDQELICYKGKDCIYEEMEGLRFKINAKSFYQTNSKQAYKLYEVARNFADLKGDELVYDLYTGTGTIAQFVAKKAKKVVGVEAVPEAIADAKANALVNGISNVTFYVGDMKNVFNDDFIAANGTPDVIITDPPRDGMHKDVVAQILQIAPEKIVYVSCNSATQARDLALMDELYKVTKVQPVDMFPQTYHVENVVLLERR